MASDALPRTEALFREVNERIEAVSQNVSPDYETMKVHELSESKHGLGWRRRPNRILVEAHRMSSSPK
jgi:hypothetical protein